MYKKLPIQKLPELFLIFLKLGLFCFGGGWSIISQIEEECIQKRQWITNEKLLDFISVGRSLPGIMVINICVILGYDLCGILGAILAAGGVALPSVAVLCAVELVYDKVIDNVYVAKILAGVRASVVSITFSAAVRMWKTALNGKLSYVVMLLALILLLFTEIGNTVLILGAVGLGVLLNWRGKIDSDNS